MKGMKGIETRLIPLSPSLSPSLRSLSLHLLTFSGGAYMCSPMLATRCATTRPVCVRANVLIARVVCVCFSGQLDAESEQRHGGDASTAALQSRLTCQ